jgi:hypothetical protein
MKDEKVYPEYKESAGVVTKDGHTMYLEDIIKDIKAYIKENKQLRALVAKLEEIRKSLLSLSEKANEHQKRCFDYSDKIFTLVQQLAEAQKAIHWRNCHIADIERERDEAMDKNLQTHIDGYGLARAFPNSLTYYEAIAARDEAKGDEK